MDIVQCLDIFGNECKLGQVTLMKMMMMVTRDSGQVQRHKASLTLHTFLVKCQAPSVQISRTTGFHYHTESLLSKLRSRSRDAAATACSKNPNSLSLSPAVSRCWCGGGCKGSHRGQGGPRGGAWKHPSVIEGFAAPQRGSSERMVAWAQRSRSIATSVAILFKSSLEGEYMASNSQAVLSGRVFSSGQMTSCQGSCVADAGRHRFSHYHQSDTAHRRPLDDPVHQAPRRG